jgi:hypothetical protein
VLGMSCGRASRVGEGDQSVARVWCGPVSTRYAKPRLTSADVVSLVDIHQAIRQAGYMNQSKSITARRWTSRGIKKRLSCAAKIPLLRR